MTTSDLRRRWRFFFEHAGYVGFRAAGALELAKAEIASEELEFVVLWEDDAFGCNCDRAEDDPCRETFVLVVGLPGRGLHEIDPARPCAVLGGICDPDSDFMRVCEAKLSLEVLGQLRAWRTSALERERLEAEDAAEQHGAFSPWEGDHIDSPPTPTEGDDA